MQPELSGVLVIDKPANITSAKVTAFLKKALKARKTGHAGTLDPFATGVLVCCINSATRLARFFLHDNKKYEAVLHLGVATDTQDPTGTITSTCDNVNFSEKTIRSAFKQFEGAVDQLPPIYSALKHKKVPLYKLARSGKPVQKPARPIYISYIKILDINLPFIRFEVSCSAGTYIRTLCADIGKSLGCGGHLKELKRIESSGFTIRDAINFSELKELALSENLPDNLSGRIISMADALPNMPAHIADNALKEKIKHGKTITKTDFMSKPLPVPEGFIKVVEPTNDLIAVLNLQKESDRFKYCCVFNN
ncbi:MAG: tRNA pseudouridine(55) synthase TruB [Deltaproteobacteria bacterium CG1_02_45_11]|nr:MAG: tRNA pseudouridine(55) synthase TruB [Deltaproteobacteria bacterium CG1_02_45_11]